MLTTIVFFIALLLSYMCLIRTIDTTLDRYTTTYINAFIWTVLACAGWSWLFYLLQ